MSLRNLFWGPADGSVKQCLAWQANNHIYSSCKCLVWGTDCICLWFCPELHKRKIPCVNVIQDTCSSVSAMAMVTWCRWHIPHTTHAGVGEGLCFIVCAQMLTKPHISKTNAVNPDIGKKLDQRPEGPGIPTSMLFLPGMWKHTQTCHALNEPVIAKFSCHWWCSSSYNTPHYLMRGWLCSWFSQFTHYVVLWKEKKVTAAYFPSLK